MSAAAVVLPFVWAFSAAEANPFARKTVQREAHAGGPMLATAGLRLRALGIAAPSVPAFGMLGTTEAPAVMAASVVPESDGLSTGSTRRACCGGMSSWRWRRGGRRLYWVSEMFRGKVTNYEGA